MKSFNGEQYGTGKVPAFVLIGLGTVGLTLLPLLRQTWPASRILGIDQDIDQRRQSLALRLGVQSHRVRVTQDNYVQVLAPLLAEGVILLNLAHAVCSRALIELAQSRGANYLDTCIDPWEYKESNRRGILTNRELRDDVLSLCTEEGRKTAIVAHGANPGFVSTLTLHALDLMRKDHLPKDRERPRDRVGWAVLARELGIRVIQIAEHDTQGSSINRLPDEFVNTWSVDAFVAECLQPAELGLGSHERSGCIGQGSLTQEGSTDAEFGAPGCHTRVRSWCPGSKEFAAWLVSHNESLSISRFLSVSDSSSERYSPTVYFAYRPSADTVQSLPLIDRQNQLDPCRHRIMAADVISGKDELGVLLISDRFPSLWLGSQLSAHESRSRVADSNATGLQVASSILAALVWMIRNPAQGVVESEALDHDLVYELVAPYWSLMAEYTDWPHTKTDRRTQIEDFLIR